MVVVGDTCPCMSGCIVARKELNRSGKSCSWEAYYDCEKKEVPSLDKGDIAYEKAFNSAPLLGRCEASRAVFRNHRELIEFGVLSGDLKE